MYVSHKSHSIQSTFTVFLAQWSDNSSSFLIFVNEISLFSFLFCKFYYKKSVVLETEPLRFIIGKRRQLFGEFPAWYGT